MADAKKSDLPVRAASAVAMIAVAGGALWLGGWYWTAFVAAIAAGVLWEWWGLVRLFVPSMIARATWMLGGLIYIGIAAFMFDALRLDPASGWPMLLIVLFGVILTDVGAYACGRAFGHHALIPTVSPKKTWEGLLGGIVAGAIAATICDIVFGLGLGVLVALLAGCAGRCPAIWATDSISRQCQFSGFQSPPVNAPCAVASGLSFACTRTRSTRRKSFTVRAKKTG